MSRVIFSLVVFGLVLFSTTALNHGFRHHGGHHHEGHHPFHHNHDCENNPSCRNDTLGRIKIKYSMAKSSLQELCNQNTQITPKILYGSEAYFIKYPLPDTRNLNITVKAVNGLIITEVKELGDFKGFQDVRNLPEILDLPNSFWSIEQLNLKILLPYKMNLGTEFNPVCEPYGSEVVILGNVQPIFNPRINTN